MEAHEKEEVKKIRESLDGLYKKLEESDTKIADLKKKLLTS